MHTLSQALSSVQQLYQVNPISKPAQVAERVPLATPVLLRNGIEAVISGHSTADCQSYRVSWFDPHFRQVHHKWLNRSCFEVAASNKTATAA